MLKHSAEQLELYQSGETSSEFFDTVIFCTNVTYADGHFKGGAYFLKTKNVRPSITSPDRPSWYRSHLARNRNGERGPGKSTKRTRSRLEISDTRIPHGRRPRLTLY